MKIPMNKTTAFIAATALVYVYYRGHKAATANTTDENGSPVSDAFKDNPVYAGVNAIGQHVTKVPYWSLGTWLYDITHPNEGI